MQKNVLKYFSCDHFSLGQELLSCILDIVDVPEVLKGSESSEDDFIKILDWCDIWIILLKTTGRSCDLRELRGFRIIFKHDNEA